MYGYDYTSHRAHKHPLIATLVHVLQTQARALAKQQAQAQREAEALEAQQQAAQQRAKALEVEKNVRWATEKVI